MAHSDALRKDVLELLKGKSAHVDFDAAVSKFPLKRVGEKPEGLPYTAWQLLEHLRIAQQDILEFSRNPKHVSPPWPEGYWPGPHQIGNADLWQETVTKFRNDLNQVKELVSDAATDLFARIPHGSGQTALRETLLVADHNAYHLGALVVMGRIASNS